MRSGGDEADMKRKRNTEMSSEQDIFAEDAKEWKNIARIISENRFQLRQLLTNEALRVRIQFFCLYIVFFAVSVLMTVVNVITGWHLLMLSTLVFAIVNLINLGLSMIGARGEITARILFAVEFVTLFAFFAIVGQPEGFSAIWIALLPACGLLLYRLKYGMILSLVQFAVILFLFWTKTGNSLLMYEYTPSFLLRFPLLYVAFFCVGAFFEFIRYATQKELSETRAQFEFLSNHDALTGLLNRSGFNAGLEEALARYNKAGHAFAIVDLDDFKKINDRFGHASGDVVLRETAEAIRGAVGELGIVCRWGGEEFSILLNTRADAQEQAMAILRAIRAQSFSFAGVTFGITASLGMVEFDSGYALDASAIISAADENLYTVKRRGKNNLLVSYLSPEFFNADSTKGRAAAEERSMRKFTTEQLLMDAEAAFAAHQFVTYFQPQYSIHTGLIIGAEALVRWDHPKYGLLNPGAFVPAFERNGLISRLDLEMFENVCRFQRRCIGEKMHAVPISVNLTRADVYNEAFLRDFEAIRARYGISAELIHIEIVESIASEGKDKAVALVDNLHSLGYRVDLDDFGSGYSSLNVLKDIDYDLIKLDMDFLSDDMSGRGGTIIGSVVRMAKWLGIPVIAEGVEMREQVDFLKSIGCEYAQGYFYARPMPDKNFAELLVQAQSRQASATPMTREKRAPDFFRDNRSAETLVFNNYIGGAAIFHYSESTGAVIVRVNENYLRELHMNHSVNDVVGTDIRETMDGEMRSRYEEMLRRAIRSGEEQVCETWRSIRSDCCGEERLCIESRVAVIGQSGDEAVIYAEIHNVTDERLRLSEEPDYERQFRNVIEQANIYYWEYTVATKEMHPCFRCMRDLGLPAVVTNYPETAIEKGIIPPDYAELYRDWHRRIDRGEKSLEAVIPLTVGRVPFHVRYTTEFDELGRPVKAFASATLVTAEESFPT